MSNQEPPSLGDHSAAQAEPPERRAEAGLFTDEVDPENIEPSLIREVVGEHVGTAISILIQNIYLNVDNERAAIGNFNVERG